MNMKTMTMIAALLMLAACGRNDSLVGTWRLESVDCRDTVTPSTLVLEFTETAVKTKAELDGCGPYETFAGYLLNEGRLWLTAEQVTAGAQSCFDAKNVFLVQLTEGGASTDGETLTVQAKECTTTFRKVQQ